MSVTVLVNGEPTSQIDIADRGFQYGDGVFTTLRVTNGIPLFLDRHLARLERDSRRLCLPFPDPALLSREVHSLCAARPDGVLKIQLTRGSGGRGYRCPELASGTRVLGIHPPPDYPPDLAETGILARVCATRLGINPALAGIKHLNRLEQILARAEWPLGEIREGVMLDAAGQVVEGVMTNLFMVKVGEVVTPKLDLCGVEGVMRGLIFECGQPVTERRVSLDEVYAADELFLTNSVLGLWPIRRLEQREYPIGPVTQMINACLNSKIQKQLTPAIRA